MRNLCNRYKAYTSKKSKEIRKQELMRLPGIPLIWNETKDVSDERDDGVCEYSSGMARVFPQQTLID